MFDRKILFRTHSYSTITNVDFNINALDVLYKNAECFRLKYFKKELNNRVTTFKKKLYKRINEFERDELKHIKDDFEMGTNESLIILSNFIIVATYSYYEKGLKKIMQHSNTKESKMFEDDEIENCYNFKNFKKLFKDKGIIENIKKLDDYVKVNELKCLNNVIKHKGIVDPKLKNANPKWKMNSNINNTYEDFLRLKDSVSDFLTEIISNIYDKIPSKIKI